MGSSIIFKRRSKMELKIQKITKFKTPDQKEFCDEESAKAYMRDQFLRDQLNTSLSRDFPKRIDYVPFKDSVIKDVVDFIMTHQTSIVNLYTNSGV